ncbi:MAG: transcriptional repressor NrdR [Candidatus Magasanikbacteria bacterium]|nr:transcriptional repressor NrdR [Candidatus Magasanikbacteria bacterium]
MKCPICRNDETKVVDSRLTSDSASIRRRRECTKCAYRFSTIEEMELLDIVVVKNNGRREAYSRNKLEKGIQQALTKRPVTEDQFDQLIHAIESDIQKKKQREVTSKDLGEMVMRHLRKFDKVAYIRFASIYRAFTDVKGFQSEVSSLEKDAHSKSRRTK